MRDANDSNSGDTITVKVGRFGNPPREYTLPRNTTVGDALQEAGIDYDSGNVHVGGNPANEDSLLDDGDVINVSSSKKGG